MPKLVKLAPNGSTDRSPLQQESKKRKRPIGKSHALVTSKPLTIVAPTPIITARNEDSVSSTKYTFTSQPPSSPSLALKKKDSTVQCSQTTTIKTGVSGSIPVGIAVARQRYTQSSSSSTEVQRQRETTTTTVSMPEVVHQSPMQTMVLSYNDCSMTTGTTAGINRWPSTGSCSIPQNTVGSQYCFQNTTLRAPTLEQQSVQPIGYQLVQDQSGQFFLWAQNSITGLMTMPFDYCKPEAQNHQPNQGYTLIQQPPQQMATISPIINHHPQYTSIASSGSFLIQQVNSSTPPALINTHHQLTDTSTHQQPLIQLASPENQMIIFNQQQSAIVAQPMIGHLHPSHPGLSIATQMQTGCQNQINDIQTVSESVTVQTKLVQQSITEKSTISSHTEENVSISLDYCNTTISEPEKDVKHEFSAQGQLLVESNMTDAIISHDASNQTDLQADDETYHSLTDESKETNFIESTQDCTDNSQPLTDGATQTVGLSITENSATPDITGLELLLNSIEQFEKRNSYERLNSTQPMNNIGHWEEVIENKDKTENAQTACFNANIVEEVEEKGVNKIDLLLLAEQFLETEKSSETSERDHIIQSYSNNKSPLAVMREQEHIHEYNQNINATTESFEVTNNKGVAKKVYTNKSLIDISRSTNKSPQVHSKLEKIQSSNEYFGSKVLKRKVLDSNLSSSGKVKRGPGRPKKILKEDVDDSNIGNDVKEKRLKLDCSSSKIKHKISSSSSSDLSPPILEPLSPFSPRKDSTRTPPTLSPIPSVAKLLFDIKNVSNDEKKITKKRSTSLILTSEDEFKPPLKKRKVGRPRKNPNPPIDEVVVKKYQKKEKPVSSSSKSLNNVPTIKVNTTETSSSGQYKIKPKLKAEVKIKHWDVDDEDDEIKDQEDILASPKFVCKKRQMADALHRMSPCIINKPAVIPKKRKFSNVSLNSIDSLDDIVSFPRRDTSYNSIPVRNQTSESDVSLEQTNEERDSSTTVELIGRQCTSVSPSRPNVDVTTADDDYERKRLKKKRKHRKHKHSHDESRTKHKHKHHKKHHKKHRRHRVSEPELSVSEPPTLSPQTPVDEEDDDDDDKSKENDSSEVDSSDFPTFLSDQQIWKWSGDSYKRPGRGGNKKTFYKSIVRGDETISIGDCAVFLSSGRPDRPFIGKVDCMWETNMEKMQVKVFWFYHPEETASGFTGELPYPGALFKSPHNDVNDVQSIMNGCRVVSFEEFRTVVKKEPKRLDSIYDNNDLFYLAGDYEPVMKIINFSDGVMAATTTTTTTAMPSSLNTK